MDQLTLPLHVLVGGYAGCFRAEVFQMFRSMLGAWIVCLGRRTISRVWETTGHSQHEDHSAAFRLFSQAAWNWDEVCRLFILDVLAHLVPGMHVWLVVDDTLCHKRGAHVAFGGIFLDAVLSTSKHKIFRYGNNWVTLGLVVQLPCRPDRYYCLNVLWRVCEKRGGRSRKEHRSKPQLAAEMIRQIASWLPKYKLHVVADVAYADGKGLLGFHDPEVWCAHSVERAHPMSWFVGSLVVLWYALFGHEEPMPQRHRPWYAHKPAVTFADMLATCRYHLWRNWLAKSGSPAELEDRRAWLLEYLATAA